MTKNVEISNIRFLMQSSYWVMFDAVARPRADLKREVSPSRKPLVKNVGTQLFTVTLTIITLIWFITDQPVQRYSRDGGVKNSVKVDGIWISEDAIQCVVPRHRRTRIPQIYRISIYRSIRRRNDNQKKENRLIRHFSFFFISFRWLFYQLPVAVNSFI